MIPIVHGQMTVRNLGLTGFETTHENYTSLRSVFLDLTYAEGAVSCRFINYDNPAQLPAQGNSAWTPYESCVSTRAWMLSENAGSKTVYFQVNYSSSYKVFNDSIYYNYTGVGLDTTPPNAPGFTITLTNNNNSIKVYVPELTYPVPDPESEILGTDTIKHYLVYTNISILAQGTTQYRSLTVTNESGFNLQHGTRVYFNVSVSTAGGMSEVTSSYPLHTLVDIHKPYVTNLAAEFYNLSTGTYQQLKSQWTYANQVNISWNFTEDYYTPGFTYTLSTDASVKPDLLTESDDRHKVFSGLASGTYYFRVKPKDDAGNWGDLVTYIFYIDNTPSTKPEIRRWKQKADNLTYYWTSAKDSESGVVNYRINLTKDGVFYDSVLTNSTSPYTFQNIEEGIYNATIGALNGVGLWRWSVEDEGQTDTTPPVIQATPNGTVTASSYPILRVWSDEQSVCSYSTGGAYTTFSFTNSTYHETKVYPSSEGSKSYELMCEDMAGNQQTGTIYFTINSAAAIDAVSLPPSLSAYEGVITEFRANLTDTGGNPVAGLKKENFTVYIDDEEIDFNLMDTGTGSYGISMFPEQGTVKVVSGAQDTMPLTLIPIRVSVIYEDTFITSAPTNTRHITYFTRDNRRLGLASDYTIDIEDENVQSTLLNISGIPPDENIFLFNTKASISMNDREKGMEEFFDMINPAFGYSITDYYINIIILTNELPLRSDSPSLSEGTHDLYVVRYGNSILFTQNKKDPKIVVVSD